MEPGQALSFIEVLAIIISIVALLITVIGFFASLKFYRDGMMLQSRASDALARIEEKAVSLQTQVGGMFDKTLEAAIGRSAQVNQNFEAINEQLETTTKKIVDSAVSQIGSAGEAQRKQLTEVVDREMSRLRLSIDKTRESAEELAQSTEELSVSATGRILSRHEEILEVVRTSSEPLSLDEIGVRVAPISRSSLGAILFSLHRRGLVLKFRDDAGKVRYKISALGLGTGKK